MSEILPRPMVLDEFVDLVGQDLLLDSIPHPLKLRLIEASPLRTITADGRRSFILVFRSVPEQYLVDGTYLMKTATFGPTPIFISSIVPPQGSEAGYYYQAIFN